MKAYLGYMMAAIIVLSTACTKKALSPEDYAKWVQNPNGPLNKIKVVGEYEFSLQYQPADYSAIRELKDPKEMTMEKIKDKAREYENRYSFTFKIATKGHDKDVLKNDIGSAKDYYGRLQYFISPIQHDLFLSNGNDTLPCAFVNYERTFSVSPFSTFTVVFDKSKNSNKKKEDTNSPLTFIYNDQVLGTGPVNISFDHSTLSNTPSIVTR